MRILQKKYNLVTAGRLILFGLLFSCFAGKAQTTAEPYINELKGPQVAVDSFFTVADEKFNSTASWSLINQHISVDDIVSFEINFDTSVYFYNQPFACTVNFKIYLYGNQADTSQITDSVTHSNVSLDVRYDTVTGKPYKGIALYKFKDAHKFKVKILSITSAELNPIPAIFRVKGQIIVNRKYHFNDNSTDITSFSVVNGNQLKLDWIPSLYPGAEMFDLEYTFIDKHTQIANSIETYASGSNYTGVPTDSLAKWFKNNSSRITTSDPNYLVNMAYDSGYVLFRIRGVQISTDNVRWEGNWNYNAKRAGNNCSAVVKIDGHEQNLNWQFSVSFAEEGKRKEVISYFDGSLRNRQSVTLTNTDNKSVIQETIYDALGRPAAAILPAPTDDSTIHYFRGFNKNGNGTAPYSFADLLYADCNTTADSIDYESGAGRYYSTANPFLNQYHYAKYIPNAGGYPLTVTEYMADNTGRIKKQGGVGPAFQLHSGHATKYFYGKPNSQDELDRLFGSEAGIFTHYLKNMVIDANNQVSVSYVDASGKTVATALAGLKPDNLQALPSNTEGTVVTINSELITPGDFRINTSDYSLTASATFLAPVTGDYKFKYRVDPLRYSKLYGPDKDSTICSNCYYDLEVLVKDDCNNLLMRDTVPAGNVFDTTCNPLPPVIEDSVTVGIPNIGEYYITYILRVSKDALDFFDSTHLVKNSDIKKLNYFLLEELKNTDFTGCYNNCETCIDELGEKDEFYARFKSMYINDSVYFDAQDSLYIDSLYQSLLAHCQSIQAGCGDNVCDEKLAILKLDVSPGGQYALYSDNYTLLEPTINVLNRRNQISYFVDEEGNRDSIMLYDQYGEDSIKVDVRNLSDSNFIKYWKDSWADSLVRLHPEYCYYLWCVANTASSKFDRDIQDWEADTAMARDWFDPNDYEALLKKDPFFNGGGGSALYNKMKDSLRLFSRTMVRLAQSDKNILQVVDIVLYCNQQYNGWDACNPDSSCRSRNREWFMYQQWYLNLKARFYEEARRTSSNPIFANCVNCYIGDDVASPLISCPDTADFSIVSPVNGTDTVFYKDGVLPGVSKTVYVKAKGHTTSGGTVFESTFVFKPGDRFKEYPNANSILDSITFVSCDTSAYSSFVDSTCNYSCPGGVYNPYDRDSLSFFVQYGNPNTSPSGVPSGYGACRFYAVFDLKTGATTSCKFFNVWVCVYDSTCGGICNTPPTYPSSCPSDTNAVHYKNKQRRYPEYVNPDQFINNAQNSNPQQSSDESLQSILDECASNCEAQADVWINSLSRCVADPSNPTDSLKLVNLKAALIEVCSKGCSMERIFGASTIPESIPATYHSFEEAIVGILGSGALNDSCTAELLEQPYPYDKQPVTIEKQIMQTDYAICQKLNQYKASWTASGSALSFHSWLKTNYSGVYTLDSLELDDMLNSCTNCNGILKDDIVLPVLFDPGSSPCQSCDSIETALTAFQTKFPAITSSDADYETLFRNFFNHRFGFSLGYEQYKAFLDSCENASYAFTLCNQAAAEEQTITGTSNSCMADLFATALTNATATYIAYIDSVRRDFRDAWMTKCLNVQPKLNMTADLYEYHYTLYYYDQSGNLVKTIPPEGVQLLNDEDLQLVKLHRLLQSEGCYQYSDSIKFNNNGQIEWDSLAAFEAQPYSIEMRINASSFANQVLVSKLSELEYDTSATADPFYRHAGVVLKIESNKLAVALYGIRPDTTQKSYLAASVRNVSSLFALNTWTHLALQYTGDTLNPVRIYINGNPVTLTASVNDLTDSLTLSGSAPLIAGSHSAAHLTLPGKLRGSIKNLRIYDRLLSSNEMRQNAFNFCQTPSSQAGLLFWSAMNDAAGNLVPEMITRSTGVLTGFTWQPFAGVFPDHGLPTVYQYNSLNQVVQQYSPDGDTSVFFYDRLGRLTVSQNKEQKENASYSGAANRFSYTKYDGLGRITEVGEKSSPSADIRTINMLDTTAVKNWLASGTDRQLTKTIYDEPVNLEIQTISTSRKRVTASIYLENKNDTEGDSTIYSYDINGNVKTLVQHVKTLVAVDASNGKKRIDYDYDLVSGKVNSVAYQHGKGDQFYYRYSYDADNRVVSSYSSRDKLVWTEDASYTYYLHGPLARTELGQYKVQGIDYAYTLQGWLKGINSYELDSAKDIGQDSKPGSIFARVSRDVYGFSLGYYNDDYTPIGTGANAFALTYQPVTPVSSANSGNQLFNGNISYTTLALSKISNGAVAGYTYNYDQLNRLTEMNRHTITAGAGTWSNSSIITAYSERISYDANGNILKYLRRGADATGLPLDMDSLGYKYNRDANGRLINNRLNHVRDAVSSNNYTVDIDDQSSSNYTYDLIGNLKADAAEGLSNINWTVYGKIKKIDKAAGSDIEYGYDATGNRTVKKVYGASDTLTYYVRDAQGNVLAVYTKKGSDALRWNEQHLYGSSRLGIWQWDTIVPTAPPVVGGATYLYDSLLLGSRAYELSNHLGNVLSTISDKKIGNDSSGVVNYYMAEVLSQNDYYPGGMEMPGRKWNSGNSYQYGFGGKRKDNEMYGEGNAYDFDNRILDPRLGGKWLSVDPLQHKYPGESPYLYTGGNPIIYTDPDGRDRIITITLIGKDGTTTQIQKIDKSYFKYSWSLREDGFYFRKEDVKQSLTIDLRGIEENAQYSNFKDIVKSTSEDVNTQYIGFGEYLDGQVRGDNSDNVSYGYRIYGKGKDTEWQEGLPTAAPGTESIDLKDWLGLAGSMSPNDSPRKMFDKIINKFGGIQGSDAKQLKKAVDIMVKQIEGIVGTVKRTKAIIEQVDKIKGNNTPSSEQGKSQPVIVPVNKTIYTKNGYKYKSEGNGRGGTVGETKDSTNATGDTTYRIKTEYKKSQ
ncbi:LamG-like jellyroll fold domain-containing protein [Terrimonas alba]|uniref:LamG-like jellyroll fold domain-containing protein n=1 Tax=Terrimonas alba TaxID=3349636 RepID=UPI0035F37E27